jgi:hypothetical protein
VKVPTGVTPIGGYWHPNSTDGAKDPCKKAQKNDTNSITSVT